MANESTSTRSLGEIAALVGRISTALDWVQQIERGMLIRELAAEDRERWGILYAALSDAQDEGAPGTVAALNAILTAALGNDRE